MELKEVVKKVIANIEKREKEEIDLFKAWKRAAGVKASKHAKPAFLKRGRLVINVGDSSWLYKLTMEKAALLEKANKNLKGKKRIKELQFRIGEI